MGAFEDVCWHEAGHGVIAALEGLGTLRILVRENSAMPDDWRGFRHGIGAPRVSIQNVASAGMAGELINKASSFATVTPSDLAMARSRASDDLAKYMATSPGTNRRTFEQNVAGHCWKALSLNAKMHAALANELIDRKKVGPLVYAEIIMDMPITASSRAADDQYLYQLELLKPAPPII